jgi:hypothetical protein
LADRVSFSLALNCAKKACASLRKNAMHQDNEKLETSAQTKSHAAREPQPINLNERLALSPREFGSVLGKSVTYAYRAIYRGWIKPVSDCGRLMIPISEVHRFLARAAEYNPQPTPKAEPKPDNEPKFKAKQRGRDVRKALGE